VQRAFVWCLIGWAVAGCATVGPVDMKGSRTAEDVCEATRPEKPDGLSGIAFIEGDRYYCVDDSGGLLYEVDFRLADDETDGTFKVVRSVKLAGRKDLEACAVDPLDGSVWVADESDHSIRRFDQIFGRELAKVAVPEVYLKNMVPNRSFESLAISPDGLRMYAANEDTLKCDGAVANSEQGGLVRIQEFARTDSDAPWTTTRQLFYPTETVEGEPYRGIAISGVSALCAPGDGTLLVLEREMSCKNPLFPSFHARIFEIDLADTGKPVAKRIVWDENTMFANYEGMTLGPELRDGSRSLVLVSDGDGEAEERILVLSLRNSQP